MVNNPIEEKMSAKEFVILSFSKMVLKEVHKELKEKLNKRREK